MTQVIVTNKNSIFYNRKGELVNSTFHYGFVKFHEKGSAYKLHKKSYSVVSDINFTKAESKEKERVFLVLGFYDDKKLSKKSKELVSETSYDDIYVTMVVSPDDAYKNAKEDGFAENYQFLLVIDPEGKKFVPETYLKEVSEVS